MNDNVNSVTGRTSTLSYTNTSRVSCRSCYRDFAIAINTNKIE
jgi:hypothetical protein